ncbi:MAG: DNA repair protein RadC [Clostridia bacterium]|nr:DNA repair protein RadC [Clostridia bacterium]
MDENKGIHAGHRQRMKERFRREGLDGFSEHEVLELLLMYAIPQRDVNPLAHTLIKHFSSLAGVLEAHESDLTRVPGIGENAALLLTLMPKLFGAYQRSSLGAKPMLSTLGDAKKFCASLFMGVHDERFYAICLDQMGHVLYTELLFEGTVDEVVVYPREVVQIVIQHNAHGVMFVHNHPSGQPQPSKADLDTTQTIIEALRPISVRVVDHLIYTRESIYSMIRQSQYDMQEVENFSYVMRSSVVPGTRGKIKEETEMVYMNSVYGDE